MKRIYYERVNRYGDGWLLVNVLNVLGALHDEIPHECRASARVTIELEQEGYNGDPETAFVAVTYEEAK